MIKSGVCVLVLVLALALVLSASAGCVGDAGLETASEADEAALSAGDLEGGVEQAVFPVPACGELALCCGQLTPVGLPSTQTLLALLGISDPGLSGQVGIQCSPLAASCAATPACCSSRVAGGLVALSCAPISPSP